MDMKESCPPLESQDTPGCSQSLWKSDGCQEEVVSERDATDSMTIQLNQCEACSLGFGENEEIAFVQHMLIKHPGSRFPCRDCGSNISYLADYDRHMKCSNRQTRLLCDVCDMTFARKDTRDRHKTRKHGASRRTITALSVNSAELEHDTPMVQNEPRMESKRMESKRVPVIKALAVKHKDLDKRNYTETDTKFLRDHLVSSDSIPRQKSLKINLASRNLDGTESHVDCADLSFKTEYEETVVGQRSPGDIDAGLRTIHDVCHTLEGSGCDVLVLAADSQRCRWYGTLAGKSFANETSQVLHQFFQFCSDHCKSSVTVVTQKVSPRNRKRKRITTSSKKPKQIKSVDIEVTNKQEQTSVYSEQIDNNKLMTEIQDEEINGFVETADCKEKPSNMGHESCLKSLTDTEATDYETADADDDFIDDIHSDYEDEIKNTSKKGTKRSGKPTQKAKSGTAKRKDEAKANFLLGITADLMKFENGGLANVGQVLRQRFTPGHCNVYSVPDFDKGKYTCSKCGYNFLWQKHLDIHQSKYKDCQPCERFGLSKQDILKEETQYCHEATGVVVTATLQYLLQSSQKACVCKICNKKFMKSFSLYKHIIAHNKNPVFKCNICSQRFTSDFSLSAHLKEHFLKPNECMNCEWRFDCEELLAIHQNSGACNSENSQSGESVDNSSTDRNTSQSQYKCSVCGKVMGSLTMLGTHINMQHPNEQYQFQCGICNTIVSDLHWYKRHIEQHEKKSFQCPFCDRQFKTKTQCLDHCRDHKSKMKELVCTVCGNTFNMKRKLDVHMRIHTGDNPFACKVEGCSKAFRSAPLLEQHGWTHKSHSFICDICGLRYKNPKHLAHHRVSHTVQWRYQCTFCTEKYHTIFKFKGHLVHSHPDKKEEAEKIWGIKIYQCKFCNKLYHDGDKLKEHENRHKGVQPFECSHCGKKFVSRENHRAHVDNHLGLKPLKCSICSRRFKKQEFLQSHMKRVHPEKVDSPPAQADVEIPLNLTRRTSFEIMVNDSLQPLPTVPYVPRINSDRIDQERKIFVSSVQNTKDFNLLSAENTSTALADVSAVCELVWNG